MDRPQSKLSFAMMSFMFKIRDILKPRKNVLAEFRRVLKEGGALLVNDHHVPDADIASAVSAGGLFRFTGKVAYVRRFVRV
ncbi:MAG: hypothetical protein WC370_05340 [Dehalococcoidales bacterium]|jgi:ubiquinone/menaquinone biosynthesis C-methylase UbiE